jgi:hypothetical protein
MMPLGHGSRVATQLDELRDVVGELDALAVLALEAFDRANWSGADPFLAERTARIIGIIARSAATATSKLEVLRVEVADDARGSHLQLSLPYTIANCLVRHESSVISRLRRRLAEVFEKPVDHQFFSDRYLPGEDPNAALLRMFKQLQWMVSLTDEETISALTRRSHR